MFISKHSNGYYYVYYFDNNGKRCKKSTNAKLKSEALKFLKSFEQKVQSNSTRDLDLKAFLFEYLKYSESHHTAKTTMAFKTTFNFFHKYIGNPNLKEITTLDIDSFINKRIKTVSLYAGRKDLINLKSAFNWSKQMGYIKVNPAKNIKRIRIPERLPSFFNENEYKILLNAVDNPQLKNIIEIAINTGLRQMEIITLNWEQINFNERLITLSNQNHITKGKRIRTIPMNERSYQILKHLYEKRKSYLVFHNNGEQLKQDYVSHSFTKYVRKAKINHKLNFHALRHSFASWLVQRGVSIYQVSKLLGHADIKTTQIYSHLRTEDLRKTVNLLNNKRKESYHEHIK